MPTDLPTAPARHLIVLEQECLPVLTIASPGAEGIRYGFEGGLVVEAAGALHFITAEMATEPFCVGMRLGHWRSAEGRRWERIGSLFESDGDFSGASRRAALWGPMPIFDDAASRWNLFYVGYRAAPNRPGAWLLNHDGRIYRAVSTTPGRDGIGGPYEDVGVVLEPDATRQAWEGLQGVDSFFPFRVGDRWLAFYGSAKTDQPKDMLWRNGLAEAPALGGPWARRSEGNPVLLNAHGASENPVVLNLPEGGYGAIFDTVAHRNTFGFATSPDGVRWKGGTPIPLKGHDAGFWPHAVRTPVGLIPEPDGTHTLYYTAFETVLPSPSPADLPIYDTYQRSSLGRARVRLITS